MSLLIESIKLLDGRFCNTFYHEQRMNQALHTLCGTSGHFNLDEFLSRITPPEQGLYKCRLVYDETARQIEFLPYTPRYARTLRIVTHNRIRYQHKFTDRTLLDRLFEQRNGCDDVLIVKKGLVTDTSYGNIVFRRGNRWYTPWSALLRGTQRQRLLEMNLVEEDEITVNDIGSFESFKVINAMLEFDGPEIEVSKIVF